MPPTASWTPRQLKFKVDSPVPMGSFIPGGGGDVEMPLWFDETSWRAGTLIQDLLDTTTQHLVPPIRKNFPNATEKQLNSLSQTAIQNGNHYPLRRTHHTGINW